MKRVLIVLCLSLPLLAYAQKRHEYTFDFAHPESLTPPITPLVEDYNGAEISLRDVVLKTPDHLVSISFAGRSDDGRGGVLKTGWLLEDGTYDHHLFIARGAEMIVTANGVQLDSLIFSRNSYVGNLKLKSPVGIGWVDPSNESWYSQGADNVTSLEYINYGQLPEIRAFTVIYRSPLDVLTINSITPANGSKIHSINTFELTFAQPVKIGSDSRFELTGPRGFNPVLMTGKATGNKVILSLPEGVVIDESIEARRGTYTLTIAEQSIITDDEDGYYNKKATYTFNVVEAYNKFEQDVIWPDMAENIEKIDTIVVGFPAEIGKFSADELKLVDREGNNVRTVQAKWLNPDEYTAARPFFKGDRDIYNYVQFVFSGEKNAPVKASGIYHLTIPEGFIWNNKYDPTAEDGGVAIGARFNPEINLEYNVNGVVYPSDEVLQAAKDLLAITGAGYPAADSEARVALQALVDEGIGADAVFEEAMAAFYAETNIEMPTEGYYLLSAVPSEGDELYVSYDHGKIGLTSNVEEAAHLLATVNEDGTLVFMTPDNKYLTQLMPSGANVSEAPGKMNNLTFARLSLKDDEGNDLYTPEQLFGLWSINGIVATNDEGEDITAYTLVNLQSKTFGTDRDKSLRYFSEAQTNAFRLTETDAPVPDAKYTFNPASGSSQETLYRIELTFTHTEEVNVAENAKSLITLVGTNGYKYNPDAISLVEGTKNKYILHFEDVKAGNYTLTIPKGTFTWIYDEKTVKIDEIKASYEVLSGIDFSYDFLIRNPVYYYNRDMNAYIRDVDMNDLVLMMYQPYNWGISNKKVIIQDVDDIEQYGIGHFEPYEGFTDPDNPDASAIRLVMDEPVKMGAMRPGMYTYVIAPATFGDENFGKWLKDPQSISKNDCHVNSELRPNILVDNDRANMKFSPALNSQINSFSEVTLTFPYYQNVEIVENPRITISNTWDNERIDATLERVEGTMNAFRFTSTEPLKSGMIEGEYVITIPVNTFRCTDGTDTAMIPNFYAMEFFFYGRPGGDAIDTITTDQQSETIYDLAGRRVKDTRKAGIYIVGGRKVVVQ